jgi:hypothetical protein
MSDARQGPERRPRTAVGQFLAQQRAQTRDPGRLELAAMLLLVMSGVPIFPLFLVAWIGGIVLLWGSPRWSLADKLLAAVVSSGLQVTLFADAFLGWAILLIGQLAVTAWMWRRARIRPVRPGYTAVALPAGIAMGLAIFLGAVGYFGVGFGMATTCTDLSETGHRCDALYHWLDAGAIGQTAIAITAATLIIVSQVTHVPRGRLRAISLALIPLSPIWIVITSVLGGLSFGYFD